MWYLKTRSKSLTIFQTRLASTDWNGLNAPSTNAEYICQYHGSLIGKHFKSLAQVMPFLIYDIVPQDVLRAWNVIGALVVLLWHTEIEDLEGYLVRLCLSHLKSNNKVCIRHLFHERSTIFSISLPNVLRASWSRSQNFTFLSTFLPLSVNLALQLSSQLSAMSPSIMYFAYHAYTAIVKHPVVTAATHSQLRIVSSTLLLEATGLMMPLNHGYMLDEKFLSTHWHTMVTWAGLDSPKEAS